MVTKFLWITFIDYKYAKCKNEFSVNLVDGSGGRFCSTERDYETDAMCGRKGKHWEAKE